MALKDSEPEPLTEKTRESLDGLLPRFWNRNNPIDILGDATAKRYSDVIQTCVASKNFDGILVMFVPQAVVTAEAVADAMIEAQKKTKIPLIACWMWGRDVAPAIERLNLSGIPTYDTPERAVRAFGFLVQYVRNLELLQEVPERFLRELEFDTEKLRKLVHEGMTDKEGFLTKVASKTILETYGINVSHTIVASHARDVSHLSREVGFPVVMKIVSPDITHKTEVNGIRLDIRSEPEARHAFDEIMATVKTKRPDARIEGVAIQPYVINPDVELLLGAKRDPSFGPVLLFGLGGIYTEVIRDRSIGLPPLNRLLIKRLMQETRAYKLLQGYRGRPAADMALIEEMIVRLSQLLIDVPEIKEADLNPVVVKDGLPIAVDARISLSISPQPSPMHLVISPYPTQYEHRVVTKSGIQLFIRPIRPEDGSLFVELFSRMSAASLYYRFCRSIKVLTPEMLYRLTQIDYDRELALVAIADEAGENRIIGAARIINGVDGTKAEFSIMIADAWQGKGIGVKLLEDLIRSGRDRRLEKIWGYVLPENRNMLKLGKKVGFASRYDSDVGMTVLTIDLQIV